MPSVIALLECREARAQEELDSWLEALREAEECVVAARGRVERARTAREEVLRALAEEGEGVVVRGEVVPSAVAGPGGDGVLSPGPVGGVSVSAGVRQPAGAGGEYDPRPPQWRSDLGEDVLSGVYRQVFALVAAAAGPVAVRELTAALGRDTGRLNEVEKVRHRAYALEARGWLVRELGGVFRAAAGPAAQHAARASAGAHAPSSG